MMIGVARGAPHATGPLSPDLASSSSTERRRSHPLCHTVPVQVRKSETYRMPTVEVARWMAGGAVPEIRVKWPDGRVEVLPLELKLVADQTQAEKDWAPRGRATWAGCGTRWGTQPDRKPVSLLQNS